MVASDICFLFLFPPPLFLSPTLEYQLHERRCFGVGVVIAPHPGAKIVPGTEAVGA